MGFYFFSFCLVVPLLVMSLFMITSKKEKQEYFLSSSFECGFTSYFYSRYSFSIHYFIVGLVFLFLDLELCVVMPLINGFQSSMMSGNLLIFFVMVLLWGLLKEWKEGKLMWVK